VSSTQFAEGLRHPSRKLRRRAWRLGASRASFSLTPDVSIEEERLGLLGGTTDRGAAAERPSGEVEESRASVESRRRAASALIDTHDRVFRRTARRYSICADDAEDAYQRALEIFLTKAPPIEGDALVRWMQTVTKREALAVRRQRERLLGAPRPPNVGDGVERDPLDLIASDAPGPNDKAASRERVARSGEALQALKPQEARALTLKAQGYSYAEIGEITGWSYTKINRCMAEGRKRFLQTFAEIEQGRRCEELAAALSEFADGEDGNGSTEALRFHLRSCAACRAKLRAYRSIPDKVYELMPVGPVADLSMGGRPHEWLAERAAAAVDKLRELGYSVVSRAGDGGGDAVSVTAAGGTRGAGMAAIAKVLAICGATAAGGATCVATGVVHPGDLTGGSGDQTPAVARPAKPAPTQVPDERPTEPAAQPERSDPAPDPKPATPAPQQPTPVQQKSRQFNFEAAPKSSSSSSSGSEFGGPTSGSGGDSGGGGGGGGGGSNFGIE
jgi:RNA polymerase sigma factor (sigma-70 family)